MFLCHKNPSRRAGFVGKKRFNLASVPPLDHAPPLIRGLVMKAGRPLHASP
jgi:hypothetical protein